MLNMQIDHEKAIYSGCSFPRVVEYSIGVGVSNEKIHRLSHFCIDFASPLKYVSMDMSITKVVGLILENSKGFIFTFRCQQLEIEDVKSI